MVFPWFSHGFPMVYQRVIPPLSWLETSPIHGPKRGFPYLIHGWVPPVNIHRYLDRCGKPTIVCVYIYIYNMHIYIHNTYIHIYVYTHIMFRTDFTMDFPHLMTEQSHGTTDFFHRTLPLPFPRATDFAKLHSFAATWGAMRKPWQGIGECCNKW